MAMAYIKGLATILSLKYIIRYFCLMFVTIPGIDWGGGGVEGCNII